MRKPFDRLRVFGRCFPVPGPARTATVLAALATALAGCAAPGPRVTEVLSAKRLKFVMVGNEESTGDLGGYRRRAHPKDLPPGKRCEEFYVRWTPDTIGFVRFEYRQPRLAGQVQAQTFVPDLHPWTTFRVCGDDLADGGFVTAWRVTLWQGEQMVAEKQSSLW